MLLLQTDPATNQAERTCFMAQLAATSSFRIKGAWTLGSPWHWCAGFNAEAKVDHYSSTDWIISMSLYLFALTANFIVKSSNTNIFKKLPPQRLETPEVLPVGKWVHVAASYDHNTGNNSLYVNGQLRVSRNISRGDEIATFSQKVRMGTIGSANGNFKGKIAEMKVYNVALNEAQIETAMGQGSWKLICTFPWIIVAYPLRWSFT